MHPIGSLGHDVLCHIQKTLMTRFDLACRISQASPEPNYAFNEAREQYDSKMMIKRMIRLCPSESLRFLAVTRVDLYVPILKFVYGLAQIEGKCALISLHRLCPRFYDKPSNLSLLLERTEKTVLHELGHTFGLTHCRNRPCVMQSSTRITDTDEKDAEFCPTCFELIRWRIEKFGGNTP
ncbi:archaemetzincin family Zn-dependent metalloprotease [Thermodesulfobacteriota bacterium]